MPEPTERDRDPALTELWRCPCLRRRARASFERLGSARCRGCGTAFTSEDGIWQLFWPHETTDGDVTEMVKAFYEEHPFPNYDDHDSVRSLIEKSRARHLRATARRADPVQRAVLEVGCGTGQLIELPRHRLPHRGRRGPVYELAAPGREVPPRARAVARALRADEPVPPALRPEQFDVVLCNGVLHHTSDPHGGFRSIARLVKPGGHIVIGLYNKYGRLLLDCAAHGLPADRRALPVDRPVPARHADERGEAATPGSPTSTSTRTSRSTRSARCWTGSTRTASSSSTRVPKTRPWEPFSRAGAAVRADERGTTLDRALAQAKMIVTGIARGRLLHHDRAQARKAMIEPTWYPTNKQLKQFALICLPGFSLVGLMLTLSGAPVMTAYVLAGVGAILMVIGLRRPVRCCRSTCS